ncbi:hypothetical protein [Tolypothrix sp. VBCCA 56010]
MTAGASTEGTSARHCLPNAPCPMPYNQQIFDTKPPENDIIRIC